MKYTFMDLLLKRVLKTTELKKQSHRKDRVRVYNYVIAAKNFPKYKPLAHEMIYLSPYYRSKSMKILFRNLVAMGFQNAGGKKRFIRNYLVTSPNLEGYFKSGLFNYLFAELKLTDKGFDAQQKIKLKIAQLEKELPEILQADKKKALEILLTIKGNIFLLKDLDFDLLKQIDRQLMEEFQRQNRDYDTGCYGCATWDTYDSYEDSFDSSYDSADSGGGDSGCSSCSGCSGCGGCGGCS
ncbi:hypothetical protein [Croceimicrobium sp.]|uniref:hypothetical protein n=1 Tax=Croceimicrobium sp. TaxID=2828340 RepID=UPI003BADA760